MSLTLMEEPAVRQQIARFSVASYRQMVESGLVPEQTELMQGVIVYQMTKSPDHNYFATAVYELLRPVIPPGTLILAEKSLTTGGSELEPDIMVIEGPLVRYRDENPKTALLVVEIARSSLRLDQAKAPLYALAGVAEYWIVDLEHRVVLCHKEPRSDKYLRVEQTPFESVLPIFGAELRLDRV